MSDKTVVMVLSLVFRRLWAAHSKLCNMNFIKDKEKKEHLPSYHCSGCQYPLERTGCLACISLFYKHVTYFMLPFTDQYCILICVLYHSLK